MFRLASFLTVSIIISVVSILTVSSKTSSCICTTVQCPVIGINTLIMGNGGATIHYTYIQQNDVPVISSAEGIVTVDSLDNGSETTDCTQKYSRTLEDDGSNNCDGIVCCSQDLLSFYHNHSRYPKNCHLLGN
jgi:hypothetical protein